MQNTELIPQAELDKAAALLKTVIDLKKEAIAIAEALKGIPNASGGGQGGGRPNTSQAQSQLMAAEKESLRIANEYSKVQQQIQSILQGRSAILTKAQAERNRDLVLERAIAKEQAAAEGSLERMQKTLSRMLIEQGRVNRTTAEGQKIYDNMGVQITKLYDDVTKLEQGRGNFGRQVGNYAKGFNSLSFQVQQVARELPSLTVSTQQFFLAISNNLPMLADEVGKAREKYNAFKKDLADGKDVEKVDRPIKQIIGSILSWQTALVVGITLLSKYGSQIVSWAGDLIKGKNAADDLAKSLKSVNNVVDASDLGRTIGNFERLKQLYAEVGDNAKAKEKFLKDYRVELDATGVAVKTIIDADNLFINNSAAYISAVKLRAQADAGRKLADEKYGEAAKIELQNQEKLNSLLSRRKELESKSEDYSESRRGGVVGTSASGAVMLGSEFFSRDELLEENYKQISALNAESAAVRNQGDAYFDLAIQKENASKQGLTNANLNQLGGGDSTGGDGGSGGSGRGRSYLNDRLKQFKDEAKAYEDLNAEEFRMRQWTNKQIMDNDAFTVEERQAASDRYYELERQRVTSLASLQIKNIKAVRVEELTAAKKREIANATKADINDVKLTAEQVKEIEVQAEKDTAIERKVVRIKADNDLLMIVLNHYQSRLDIVTHGLRKEMEVHETAEKGMLSNLDEQRAQGLITQKEYEDERIRITENANRERLQMQLDALKNEINQLPLDSDARVAVSDAIAKKEVEIAKWESDQKNRITKDSIEYRNKLEQERREFVAEMAQQTVDFISELLKAQTERELAALEEEKEAAQEAADEEKDRIERLADAGAISEEQKNARIALADQQLAEKEKAIEDKKRETQIRQAKYDKAQALAQSMIATALSIANSAQMGFPLAIPFIAMAAVLGAIQQAAILATPLPQYATGTDNHPGGLAVVGDGGRSELMLVGGHAYKTPAFPTLVDMPKGAQVLPDYNVAIRDMLMMSTRENARPIPRETPHVEAFSDRAILAELRQARIQRAKMIKNDERARREAKFKEFRNSVIVKPR